MVPKVSVLPILFLLVAAPPIPAADAGKAPAGASANVSITLIVGRSEGSAAAKEKTYKFLGQDGTPSSILMGFRTPIPTRDDAGSTAYIYQNVGMTAELNAQATGDGRFLVSGQVEISGAREGDTQPGGKPPLIGTFQQELHVVVTNGKKVRVAEGPDPESGTLYVDLRVDRLE